MAVAVMTLVGLAGQASAASVSFVLDRSTQQAAFPDGGNYMQVTISDGANGAIDFQVETLPDLQDNAGNEGPADITAFSFNFGNSGASINNIVAPEGWEVIGQPLNLISASATGGSIFDRMAGRINQLHQAVAYQNVGSKIRGRSRMGGSRMGSVRELLQKKASSLDIDIASLKASMGMFQQRLRTSVVPGTDIGQFGEFDANLLIGSGEEYDPLMFSIIGVDGDTINDYASTLSSGIAMRGNTLFAAQIEGLSVCSRANEEEARVCIDNAAFGGSTTVVPLPPAMALMFSGLAMLGSIAATRRKKPAAKAA
jgi:hypothetical protein